MAVSLVSLLEGTGLPHLSRTLEEETLATWAELSRLALLSRLKELGVARLIERQALANAFARSQRGLTPSWTPPVHSCSPAERAGSTQSKSPVPSPRPPGMPIFDETASSSGSMAAPDEATRLLVRRELLSATAVFEHRDGQVRLRPSSAASAPASAVATWVGSFGECPDSGCGCYRLGEPRVRGRFRNLVVSRLAEQYAQQQRPVRYASIGCGSLLSDFEVLCGLRERKVVLEHICLVDTAYSSHSLAPDRKLFRVLAAFFAPARVVAFSSIGQLKEAASREPASFGALTAVLQIDATGVPSIGAGGLAGRLLVPGGYHFELTNDGHRKSTTKVKRQPLESAPLRAAATDYSYLEQLEALKAEASEGWESPLGIVESAESRERPLWADAGGGSSGGSGGGMSWAADKNANLDENAMNAALNLL